MTLLAWTNARTSGLRFGALVALASILTACATLATGVLDVSWTPPTTNADGTPLAGALTYKVYYDTTPTPCRGRSFLAVASPPARLTKLRMGELYYVSVTAVAPSGAESSCSAVASARARRP